MARENSAVELVAIEYKALYDEIEAHSGRLVSILRFDLAAVTAILTVVFGDIANVGSKTFGDVFPAAPVLLLLPLFVLIPSFTLVMAELNSITRIAAYVRIHYEKSFEFSGEGVMRPSWQTVVQCMRKEKTLGPTRLLGKALRYMLPSLALMCVILSLLSGVMLNPGGSYIVYMGSLWIVSAALIFIVTLQLRGAWSTEYFDDLAECISSACAPPVPKKAE